ncbi:LolA-related protein [Tahibacter amnicola]|uniref:Outer membrane lipoprotein carrier protein LolA n=1 Tax=Tahibacter amnicola TaxID=2976241 RepID=A0ABY6BF95_9GAMM|nr:LolA-related protein [Tahibacter amnicola]UXI68706.1 outer membrane lipoprotein carrier protein LolA [Tahibacter amnicola]
MISGIAIALTCLLPPTASLAAPESAAPPDPAALVARLRRDAPALTPYREIRFVQMLDAPLLLAGELAYDADGTLVKRVTAPYSETTRIAGSQVTIERKGKPRRSFSLKRAPALAGFLESFGATLAGDAARLARSYTLASTGNATRWQLDLAPRDAALSKHVTRVRIDGSGDTPRCFRVEEAGGDSSFLLVDTLAAHALAETPTPAALDQLCRTSP